MRPLTSAERKRLRGLAHALKPLVHAGRGGLSEAFAATLDAALAHHELVKVRFVAGKEEKAALVEALCEKLRCEEAGRIGHISILFRQHPEAEKRRIDLGADLYAGEAREGR